MQLPHPRHPDFSSVTELPNGNIETGQDLFLNRLGCAGCHGNPDQPGSAISAPDLGEIAVVGAKRRAGYEAADYILESVVNVNAYISPDWVVCAGVDPCEIQSGMQSTYRLTMTPQEMADVMAYLLQTTEFESSGVEIQ